MPKLEVVGLEKEELMQMDVAERSEEQEEEEEEEEGEIVVEEGGAACVSPGQASPGQAWQGQGPSPLQA